MLNLDKKDKDSNIQVTLVTPNNDEDTISISFFSIGDYLKKFLALWIVAAIVAGILTVGISLFLEKSFYLGGSATALIELSYDGVEEGLDPNGDELDITKLKSPAVVEEALTSLDISVAKSDTIRKNITISGVVPDSAMDELSLYYSIYSDGSSYALQAAQSLLSTTYNPTEYMISFNYKNAGYTIDRGKEILNEVINSYRDYFFETYNYNVALGNAVSVVDYTSYDYAEAVNIFSTSLDTLEEYLENLKESDTNDFRSSVTGYTLDDLISNVNVLKGNDLDKASSYITVNNVTKNDKDSMVSYYTYQIEELERKKEISTSSLDSINDSISKYEKDPLVLVVGNNTEQETDEYGNVISSSDDDEDLNKEYDELVEKKIETQKTISNYNKTISYYESILSAYKKNKTCTDEDIEKADTYLSNLNTKLTALIEEVNETSEDFYSNVAFADAFQILVPASGYESEVSTGTFKMPLLIVEGVLLVIYLGASVILSLIETNKVKSVQSVGKEEQNKSDDDKKDDKSVD